MPRAPRASTSPAPADAPARAPRALWKGAIAFGLVHIPIALYPATAEHAIDFDWLDKRTLDPVGYKRVNKKTGREIPREQIVKGVAHGPGRYVVLSDDEIAAAYPATTQTVEIEGFVPADAIPFIYLERPYYVAPVGKAAKVYALLREALRAAGRVGVARVVIQTKQHLAVLVPSGPGLVLNLLRWGADIRSWQDLPLPAEGAEAAGVGERELAMATRLVEDMGIDWNPDDYRDSFKDGIMKLVERKAAAGDTGAPLEDGPDPARAEARILDLTELLQRSLRKGSGEAKAAGSAATRPHRAAKGKAATTVKPATTAKPARTAKVGSTAAKAKAVAKAPPRRAA